MPFSNSIALSHETAQRNLGTKDKYQSPDTPMVSELLKTLNAPLPQATTREGWTRSEARARNQSRQIQRNRMIADALKALAGLQIQGKTRRDVQNLANIGALERTGLQETGATGRTRMTTQAQLERQRMADEAMSQRLGTELGWKANQADLNREWKANQSLAEANRNLVSNLLYKGAEATPELTNIYEGFSPSVVGLSGQLVPTATPKPLGYAQGKRLVLDESGNPVFGKDRKPVYETYLYNRETGQPWQPSAQLQQNTEQPVTQPPQTTPQAATSPPHPATTRVSPGGGNVDLNEYFRNQ